MDKISHGESSRWKTFRLIARILTVLVLFRGVTFIVSLTKQENVEPLNQEVIIILSLISLYLVGLTTGFFRLGLGGMITMISVVLIFLYAIIYGSPWEGILFLSITLIFAMIPAIFYMLAWYYKRNEEKQNP